MYGAPQMRNLFVQDGVIPHSTPLTIEDTILLTTKLGYRYLWIDRYCIAQGNSAHKQKQIQCMDEIYGHSIVTIIAAAGDDPHHGLPGISVTKRKPQPRVRFGSRTLVYTPYTKKEVLDSKWNHRGWTHQEAILSRRKLVFTATQVYFQCSSMHCLESIDASLEALHIHTNVRMRDNIEISRVFPLRGFGKNPEDIEKRLNEYLQRSLTTEADILNAFRGVLVAFEREFPHGIRTLCGIPIYISGVAGSSLDALAFGLLWGPTLYKNNRCLKRRDRFPSWTWVGWKLPSVSFRGFLPSMKRMIREYTPISISAEYADGLVLPWSTHHHLILSRDKSGSSLPILRICAPALDVQISQDGNWVGRDEGNIFKYIQNRLHRFGEALVRDARIAYQPKQHEDSELQFTPNELVYA